MSQMLESPGRVDQSARLPGGLLSKALPAPSGWERGLVIPFYGCSEPVLRDKCVAGTDVPDRGRVGTFPAFPVEHGLACSTSGEDTLVGGALDRFTATGEWAAGRQLQSDPAGTGAPKLDDATHLGEVGATGLPGLGQFTAAVSCLMAAAVGNGFGAAFVIHAPVRAAAYFAAANLLDANGNGPLGVPIIFSPGYTTPEAGQIRLWVTGRVWASLTQPDTVEAINRRQNEIDAWARGVGIVAFDPCLNFSIDVGSVVACPVPA